MTIDNRTDYKLSAEQINKLNLYLNNSYYHRAYTKHVVIHRYNSKGRYLELDADGYPYLFYVEHDVLEEDDD